jgi:hypothetical protein
MQIKVNTVNKFISDKINSEWAIGINYAVSYMCRIIVFILWAQMREHKITWDDLQNFVLNNEINF